MPVTIRDIARKLNMSISGVSRALGGYDDISEPTRQKVLQAARDLGYVPNQAARQLRTNKADAVGYILPAFSPRFADPFFTEFLAGLADEAAVHPFDLLISIAPPGQDAEVEIYKTWVKGHKVDGLILTHMHRHDWRARFLFQNEIPFAALENSEDELDFPRIEVDRQGGMVELVTHLAREGYRQIAFLGGPPDLKINADQLAGFKQGLAINALPFHPDLVLQGDLTSAGGHLLTKRLLYIPDPPDAVVCINDETAFGALRAAHEAGRAIGTYFGVAGFDGVQAAKFSEPPLTSLDIPVYEIARRLVTMLAAEISGQPLDSRKSVIKPHLLIRPSTSRSTSN